MDVHALLPNSHSVAPSSFAYPQILASPVEYREPDQKNSGIVAPAIKMSEYYLQIDGPDTLRHQTQALAPFPMATSSYSPSLPYSEGTVGQSHNLRPTSSSSLESNMTSRAERGLTNAGTTAYPIEYTPANMIGASHLGTSPISAENTGPTSLTLPPGGRLPTPKAEGSSQSIADPTLPSTGNHMTRNSPYSSDDLQCGEAEIPSNNCGDYPDEGSQVDASKSDSPAVESSQDSKAATAKKLCPMKVSEKRRQQNRAAQRAMRERRKRAAQHQEMHMTTILTENAFLREKVAYLSSLLVSHAIAPGGNLSWNPISPQENLAPMLATDNAASLPTRSTPGPASTSSMPLSFPTQPMLSPGSLAVSSAYIHAHESMLNYQPNGPLELEYLQQNNNITGLQNLSCASSAVNLSRPSTAEEVSVDTRASVLGRWRNSITQEEVGFQSESPIAARLGRFAFAGPLATDCCSINTASTNSSPTHTDGNLVEAMPTNL